MHLNYFCGILADAVAAAPAAGPEPTPLQKFVGSPIFFLLPLAVMFYFMAIRGPQQQRKRQQKMLDALKSGDRVGTASGIIGVVVSVKDKSVTLRSNDSKLEVTKSSVTEILEAGAVATN